MKKSPTQEDQLEELLKTEIKRVTKLFGAYTCFENFIGIHILPVCGIKWMI